MFWGWGGEVMLCSILVVMPHWGETVNWSVKVWVWIRTELLVSDLSYPLVWSSSTWWLWVLTATMTPLRGNGPLELWWPAWTTAWAGEFVQQRETGGCDVPFSHRLVLAINSEHWAQVVVCLTRWYSKCVLQHKGQEIMDGLKMVLAGELFCGPWLFLFCFHDDAPWTAIIPLFVFQVRWKTIWSSTTASRHASLCTEMELETASCTVWSTMRWHRSWSPSSPWGTTTCE